MMTEKLRQSLSAAIDDEADAFELRRVLDELDGDPQLRAVWDRYHLIGSALRGERAPTSSGLLERVWQALDENPGADPAASPDNVSGAASLSDVSSELSAPSNPQATVSQDHAAPLSASSSRLRRYTGLAVAASVAFAVVIGFGGLGSGGETELPALAGGVADEAVAVTAPARVDLSRVDAGRLGGGDDPVSAVAEVSDSDVQRAHAYMLHHTQQQAMNQAGVMSFVKMATYEAP